MDAYQHAAYSKRFDIDPGAVLVQSEAIPHAVEGASLLPVDCKNAHLHLR